MFGPRVLLQSCDHVRSLAIPVGACAAIIRVSASVTVLRGTEITGTSESGPLVRTITSLCPSTSHTACQYQCPIENCSARLFGNRSKRTHRYYVCIPHTHTHAHAHIQIDTHAHANAHISTLTRARAHTHTRR